jgi:hypothetical protein
MSFRQVSSRGQASRGVAGDSGRGRRRFSLVHGRAGRGMALLAVSGVLGVAGVIATTAAPAEAGISVSLSASPTALLTGEATTLTATAATGAAAATPVNFLYIYDATTGTRLCEGPTGMACTATEAEPVATTHDFVAYVAPFDSEGVFPPPGIAAMSTVIAVTWNPVHRILP